MKKLRVIGQVIIGITFIFSGFVKAVDPVGVAIKISDYFEAFHLGALTPMAMGFAILIAAFEFLLGAHLVMGLRIRLLAIPTLILVSFFTVLTLYLAIYNPVSDCGCFGDAIKLTNWQTFFKNLVLLPFALIIFENRKSVKEPISSNRSLFLSAIYAVFILGLIYYCLTFLPIIDFRPYQTGTNIPSEMSVPNGEKQDQYETSFILEKKGVQKEFGVDDYPYTDSSWVFIDSKTKLIQKGYDPPAKNFALMDAEGNNVSDIILNHVKPVILIIVPKLEDVKINDWSNLGLLKDICVKNKTGLYVVTSSLSEEIVRFESAARADFEFLFADETLLKTITRANPGIVLINNGTILGKWNYNRVDEINLFEKPLEATLIMNQERSNWVLVFACLFLLIAGTSIIYRNKHN